MKNAVSSTSVSKISPKSTQFIYHVRDITVCIWNDEKKEYIFNKDNHLMMYKGVLYVIVKNVGRRKMAFNVNKGWLHDHKQLSQVKIKTHTLNKIYILEENMIKYIDHKQILIHIHKSKSPVLTYPIVRGYFGLKTCLYRNDESPILLRDYVLPSYDQEEWVKVGKKRIRTGYSDSNPWGEAGAALHGFSEDMD